MTEYDGMSIKDLIFAHRVASGDWYRTHAENYQTDANGYYLPIDDDREAAMYEAINRCTDIEQAIKRRVVGG